MTKYSQIDRARFPPFLLLEDYIQIVKEIPEVSI